jgi:hypothetical protein
MVGTFLRHGSNIWLALGLAVLIVCFAAGVLSFYLLWVVIDALSFYVSEYGFHRFGFHAEPSRFAFVRKLQHRLHYDPHAEPIGSTFCSCRSGFSFPISRSRR